MEASGVDREGEDWDACSILPLPSKPSCVCEDGQIDFQITVSQPRTLSSTKNLTPPLLAISILTGLEVLRVFAIWRSKGYFLRSERGCEDGEGVVWAREGG